MNEPMKLIEGMKKLKIYEKKMLRNIEMIQQYSSAVSNEKSPFGTDEAQKAKAMNWRIKLHINPMCVPPDKLEQTSPLVFARPEEAQKFAHRMFEPPQSVVGWELESTTQPVNFKYEKEAI